MKRGRSLKKMIRFNILVGTVFLYLIYRMRMQHHAINIMIIMEYFEGIIKIILGICGVILTWNTMKIKINSRANFIAISGFNISLFTILKLAFYIGHNECAFAFGITNQFRWMIEYLQIIGLMIAINYIKEHRSLKFWGTAYGLICIGGLIWIGFYLNRPHQVLKFASNLQDGQIMGISCMLLAGMVYMMSYKEIKKLPIFERKIITVLFSIKILVNGLEGIHLIQHQSGFYIIYQVAQIIFGVVSIGYINELTLSLVWKKIDSGVKNKNEKVIRGISEQKMLITAAAEIQALIERINKQTFELERKIGCACNDQYISYTDKIKNNCMRLLKLSSNILDLNIGGGHDRTYTFEQIDLVAVIGDVVESLEPYMMQKGIQMSYTTSDKCIIAEVNQEAIERLFLNLLSNAIKYNRINGTIKVTLTQKKNQIYLCVQDSGIGIPNHYLDLIFEKFQRVNVGLAQEQEGSGLGLPIVKALVDVHHGEIKMTSKEDRGTLISIGLPIKQKERADQIKCKTRSKEILNKKIQFELWGMDR